MKILKLDAEAEKEGVIVKAFLTLTEFRSLSGDIENLVLFSEGVIKERTRAIKTGARHNHARYLLLPVCVRRAFKTETHDFEKIMCGAIEYRGSLFVVFRLVKKDYFEGENAKVPVRSD